MTETAMTEQPTTDDLESGLVGEPYRALANFHWHGDDVVGDSRWYYIEDEVPEHVALAIDSSLTRAPSAAASVATEPPDDDDEPTQVPPRSGKGSSRAAWAAYAAALGVDVVDGDERDDIIAHVEASGHPTA